MKRVNRAIELLEQDQPIYYAGAGEPSYEGGLQSAQTWADYLIVEMEHGLSNLPALDQFMRGLVEGGPTPSGHHTPAVVTINLIHKREHE